MFVSFFCQKSISLLVMSSAVAGSASRELIMELLGDTMTLTSSRDGSYKTSSLLSFSSGVACIYNCYFRVKIAGLTSLADSSETSTPHPPPMLLSISLPIKPSSLAVSMPELLIWFICFVKLTKAFFKFENLYFSRSSDLTSSFKSSRS